MNVVVVQVVFASEDDTHELSIRRASHLFELFHIRISAEAAGDCTSGQRFAFLRGDNPDHVDDFSAIGRLGRNTRDVELSFFEPEGLAS
jgi:hypothetical protein